MFFEKIKKNKICKDRIYGALFGVAVGDAFGAPYEFLSKEEIYNEYGKVTQMHPDGALITGGERTTDDTAMTIAVAKGIVEDPENPEPYVGRNFLKWYKSCPPDIGRIIVTTFLYFENGEYLRKDNWEFPYEIWETAAKETERKNKGMCAGNGALMRTVYPGLYYKDVNKAIQVAKNISNMTHWDEKSAHACMLYTDMIWTMVRTEKTSPDEIWTEAEEVLAGSRYEKTLPEKLLRPTGYVVDSFHCALYSIRSTDNFADAIITATNMGGDSDTIAAITGGLAGAKYGLSNIPKKWVDELSESIRQTLNMLAKEAEKERRK